MGTVTLHVNRPLTLPGDRGPGWWVKGGGGIGGPGDGGVLWVVEYRGWWGLEGGKV